MLKQSDLVCKYMGIDMPKSPSHISSNLVASFGPNNILKKDHGKRWQSVKAKPSPTLIFNGAEVLLKYPSLISNEKDQTKKQNLIKEFDQQKRLAFFSAIDQGEVDQCFSLIETMGDLLG